MDNGKLDVSTLTPIGSGLYLIDSAAQAWFPAQVDVLKSTGIKPFISTPDGAYRNIAGQIRQKLLAIQDGDPDRAARPGTSPHGDGKALDINNIWQYNSAELDTIMARHGFYRPIKRETWHFVHNGTRPAATTSTEITEPKELDDMYDAAAEARLNKELEKLRPIKLIALTGNGGGGWLWVDQEGNFVNCPSVGYAAIASAWGFSQGSPIRAVEQPEFDFMTRNLLGPLDPKQVTPSSPLGEVARIASLTPEAVEQIVKSLDQQPVVLSAEQLQQITTAARAGAEDGVKALKFVTVAG